MDVRQKYIEVKGYDIEDFFMDELSEMNLYTALKIATFIEKNLFIAWENL